MQDVYGRRIELSNYRGRAVLVSFYRAAVCPLCNLRLAHLIRRYPAYQRAGLEVIAFFESSLERVHQYLDRQRAPFPIIADRERVVYTQYGLESSMFGALRALVARLPMYREAAELKIGSSTLFENVARMDGHSGRMPGDFLVGPDGRIRFAYYANDAGDFALFRDIEVAAFGRPLAEPNTEARLQSAASQRFWG
jgi:hypothetical protein